MILPVTLLNLSLLKSQLQLVKISVQATAKTGAKFSGKLVVGGWWWGLRLIFQPACMILAKTCLTSNPGLCRKIQFARICSVFVNKICAGICRVVVCVFAASERMIRLWGTAARKFRAVLWVQGSCSNLAKILSTLCNNDGATSFSGTFSSLAAFLRQTADCNLSSS